MSTPKLVPIADVSQGYPQGRAWWALAGVLVVAFGWSYAGTLADLADTWNREPDYSHGYLVPAITILLLWCRRGDLPTGWKPSWWGLLPIASSILLRVVGGWYAVTPFAGWSLVLWVFGAVLCLGGTRLLAWSWPPLLFLLFMVPLPYRMESLLSIPLQAVATRTSSFLLQCLGQPAFFEGSTILLGEQVLEVERSCGGLRIFVGVFALSAACIIARRSEAWEGTLLILSAVPVALLANSGRILVTALLYRHVSSESARHFSHDAAGWVMIPIAALMLAFVQWFLRHLVQDIHSARVGDVLRRHRLST
jgi:exosortase